MLANRTVSQAAFDELSASLRDNPNDADAHLLLSRCYDAVGMPSLAHDEFAIARKLHPSITQAVLAEFKTILQKGDPADAFKIWLELKELFPNDADVKQYGQVINEVFLNVEGAESMELSERKHGHKLAGVDGAYAHIRYKQGRYSDAVRIAQYDLNMHADYAPAAVTKAEALNAMGHHREAAFTTLGIYRANPFAIGIAREYAKGLIGSGHYDLAVMPALCNLALMAGVPEADRRAVEIARQAIGKASAKTTTDAFAQFDRTMKRSSLGSNYYWGLSKLYTSLGENEKALTNALKALEYVEVSPAQLVNVAACEERLGRFDLAIKYLDNASKIAAGEERHKILRQMLRVANRQNDLAWRLKHAIKPNG